MLHLPAPFAPGLRLIDGIPIFPKHKLQAALDAGTFSSAWSAKTPVTEIAGLGPFVLAEHLSGRRLVFVRNPRYWRKDAAGTQLPYLDKLTVLTVPDQNTEALRLQTGELDLMGSGEIRPEDYAAFRRIAEQGRLRLIDAGVGLDPNVLWFNLSPAGAANPRTAWFQQESLSSGHLLRSRPAGHRQHRPPRRGGPDLRTDYAGQPAVVFRAAIDVRPGSRQGSRRCWPRPA